MSPQTGAGWQKSRSFANGGKSGYLIRKLAENVSPELKIFAETSLLVKTQS